MVRHALPDAAEGEKEAGAWIFRRMTRTAWTNESRSGDPKEVLQQHVPCQCLPTSNTGQRHSKDYMIILSEQYCG